MILVVTEFNFKRIGVIGSNEAIYILNGEGLGHKLRVISTPDKAIDEALNQLRGMVKCLEDLKDG